MNVGIWIRVSTEDQARGESPKNHEARARMYAEIKGWQVVEIYDLSGVSGKEVSSHPEAQRMFADVASGKIKGLIFSKLARLARNTRELLEFSDFFQKHDADLISLEESLDTSTPAGRLLYTVIGALAQWEREEISARVAASVPIRARQGKPTGGIGPFGYMWKDRRLVPNPEEAPVVKRAFELYLSLGRLKAVCAQLKKEGYKARKSDFSPVTLKRVLTDTTYKGLRRANYSKRRGDKKSWVLKPKEEWVYAEVEPLVDQDTWETVNALLAARAKSSPGSVPKRSRYLFGGKLACSCGTKMYVAPYNGMKIPRYRCRTCHTKLNEDVIEKHFLEILNTLIVKPEELKANQDVAEEQAELENRLELLKKELRRIDTRIDALVDLVADKSIDRRIFTERFLPLKERKEKIQDELPRIQAEIDHLKTSSTAKDYLIDKATTFAGMWPVLTYEERRKLVDELVASVEIQKEKLHFTLTYTPPFRALGKGAHNPRDSWRQPA
ncbi:site-specific DNA recombinase [Geothermobacter ehrlichii]|uniref:Site-specific DNA recombinase n=1 Tax=Geothermobacter ehrlichii TaxID=213224 RepID=A0A5D3WHV0_9BACT|nr:recombinase family protein [Geothermobacter ehrlichii]TYO96809.1 site-specific DNA recombinase [Geothermobacter ehrlichii]